MMRLAWCLVALFVAGCAESSAPALEPVDDGLVATPTTGIIRGVVVDPAVVPVQGATVDLIGTGLATTTDADGAFGLAWRGLRIIRDGQRPPRGVRVFKPTRIRRGAQARLAGYAHMLPLLFFIAVAIWGEGPAARMVADVEAVAADPEECARVTQTGSAMR